MAFQIKDFVSIAASMINHMRGTQKKITDFNPGAVARTLVEAPAVEIEELYMQMFIGLREAIPVATFQSFGFDKYPASYAHGYVSVASRYVLTEDRVIPKGTAFTATNGRSYASSAEVVWVAGTDVVVIPVVANQPGEVGNARPGEINKSPIFDLDFTISNQAIENGENEESDAARESRFAEFVASLSRGTEVACLYAAKQATVRDDAGNIIERVTRTGFTEIAGYFKIFIYSSRGAPSPELIQNAQTLLDGARDPDTREVVVVGVRSAGVRGDIVAMSERPIGMGVGVRMRSGYQLTALVRQQIIDSYSVSVRSVRPGETLLIDNVRAMLLSIDNVIEVTLSSTENIVCEQHEALVPGSVTVTQL